MDYDALLPPSVNFHLWQPCNMVCHGCFARFEDVREDILPRGHLPREQAHRLTRQLGQRFAKVTFAGGEPTLCPWLPDLIATAKEQGATTMLVSNGSRINAEYLERLRPCLDWLTLSIDSARPETHVALGRATRSGALPPEHYLAIATAARQMGIRLKVNTVVSALNCDEDLSPMLLALRPERWKPLQVLRVQGQNDAEYDRLAITGEAFDRYVERHRHLADHGVVVVPEDNDAMTGSYAMVDPAGRFFDNVLGRHRYSTPILQVGLRAAWEEIAFSISRFEARGGVYPWG